MDGIDVPEEGDYSEGLEREGFAKPKPGMSRIVMGIVSAALILLFAAWLMRGAF